MSFKGITQGLVIYAMASLLPVCVVAKDQSAIIGVGGGYGYFSTKSSQLETVWRTDKNTYSGTAFNIKLGSEEYFSSQQATRFYLDGEYTSMSEKEHFSKNDYYSVGVNWDYRLDLLPRVLGFTIGPRAYWAGSKGDLTYQNKDLSYSERTWGVGGGLGLILTPIPFLEVELKANWVGWHKKKELTNFGPYQKYTVAVPNSANININLKF